jgi:predicted transcriptional regulator
MNSESSTTNNPTTIKYNTTMDRISRESTRVTSTSLLGYITRNPGIRYRELLRLSGAQNGVLSYHLSLLEKKGKVRIHRTRNSMTRYYITQIPDKDTKIISSLKNRMIRQIVLYILTHDMCSFSDIVESSGKAQSTISWYLNRLKDARIISVESGDRCQQYTLTDNKEIKKILCKYKEIFLDGSVDNYVEMINNL